MLICFFIALLTINSVFGACSSNFFYFCSECPTPEVVQNFDVNRYTGKWYEIYRAGFAPYLDGLKCVTAEYSIKNATSINVYNRGIYKDSGKVNDIVGTASFSDPSVKSKLRVSFGPFTPPGNYWVLATDYDNYALVYSCNTFRGNKTETAWILSRTKTIDFSTKYNLYFKLITFTSVWTKFEPTDQSC